MRNKMQEFECSECDSQFEILHEHDDQPITFCPFCGSKLDYYLDDEEDWEEEE